MKKYFLTLPILFVFSSCIGLSLDIQMKKDGSGKAHLEYKVSNMAEITGRLDGNKKWAIIPVSRADFERSIKRIDGIKLASFSSRERAQDTFYNITLEYENTAALVKFLDASGGNVSFNDKNENKSISIILDDSAFSNVNSGLLQTAQQVFYGYDFSISFTSDGNCNMAITDGKGNQIPVPGSVKTVSGGKKASLSFDMADFFSFEGGLGVNISW